MFDFWNDQANALKGAAMCAACASPRSGKQPSSALKQQPLVRGPLGCIIEDERMGEEALFMEAPPAASAPYGGATGDPSELLRKKVSATKAALRFKQTVTASFARRANQTYTSAIVEPPPDEDRAPTGHDMETPAVVLSNIGNCGDGVDLVARLPTILADSAEQEEHHVAILSNAAPPDATARVQPETDIVEPPREDLAVEAPWDDESDATDEDEPPWLRTAARELAADDEPSWLRSAAATLAATTLSADLRTSERPVRSTNSSWASSTHSAPIVPHEKATAAELSPHKDRMASVTTVTTTTYMIADSPPGTPGASVPEPPPRKCYSSPGVVAPGAVSPTYYTDKTITRL